MQYLGTSLSLVLGAWRLRVQIALEDADDVVAKRAPEGRTAAHHLMVVSDDAMLGRSTRAQ